MFEKRFRQAVAIFLLGVVSGAMLAQQGGVLTPTAGVSINGKSVAANVDTAVLPGDKVQTGAGTAQLKLEGGMMQLGPNSSIIMGPVPDFGCGQAVFTSFNGMPLRVNGVEVKPTSADPAKFQIVRAAGTLTIAVALGTVVFDPTGRKAALRAGDSTTVTDAANCPAIPVSAPTAAAEKTLRNRKLIGILAGGGASGAFAGVMATRGKNGSISPSRP